MFNYAVFATQNNYYLFDGCSSNIFAITPLMYEKHREIFKNFASGFVNPDNLFTAEYADLEAAVSERMLYARSNGDMQYWFDIDEYRRTLYEHISHLMIGITEQCNMRCRYCVYGGHYQNERIHGNKAMSPEYAIALVKQFLSISSCEEKIVNFYGGEPFTNFPVIERTLEYIKTVDSRIKIYITTNGTLLNDYVCRWFSENKNVYLYVSIAGVHKQHDALRVMANGKPSFDVIRANLSRLQNMDPESYSSRVNFVFNLFAERQLFELQEFWEQDPLFHNVNNLPEITFIDCVDDDGTIKDMRNDVSAGYQGIGNPLDEYIRRLQMADYNNLFVKHYDTKFLRIHRRIPDNKNIIAGVCRPFINKLFVDCDGNLHVCENFSCGDSLGKFLDGISVDAIVKLLLAYQAERNKMCKRCWASKMCSLCFRDIYDRNGAVNLIRAAGVCHDERAALTATLAEYCSVLEHGTTLLNHLDQYILHV